MKKINGEMYVCKQEYRWLYNNFLHYTSNASSYKRAEGLTHCFLHRTSLVADSTVEPCTTNKKERISST